MQAEIDAEVRTIIDECYELTVTTLKEHLDQLHEVAQYLLKHEKIDGVTFEKRMKGELEEAEETVEAEAAEETVEVTDELPEIEAEESEEVSEENAPEDNDTSDTENSDEE